MMHILLDFAVLFAVSGFAMCAVMVLFGKGK